MQIKPILTKIDLKIFSENTFLNETKFYLDSPYVVSFQNY